MPLIPARRRLRRADLSLTPTWSTKSSRTARTILFCQKKNKKPPTPKTGYAQTSIKEKNRSLVSSTHRGHQKTFHESKIPAMEIINSQLAFAKQLVFTVYQLGCILFTLHKGSSEWLTLSSEQSSISRYSRPRRYNLNIGLRKAKKPWSFSERLVSILGHRRHRQPSQGLLNHLSSALSIQSHTWSEQIPHCSLKVRKCVKVVAPQHSTENQRQRLHSPSETAQVSAGVVTVPFPIRKKKKGYRRISPDSGTLCPRQNVLFLGHLVWVKLANKDCRGPRGPNQVLHLPALP